MCICLVTAGGRGKVKVSNTLSLNSLIQLAHGLGKDTDGLTFAMMLNVPTTTIMKIMYDNDKDGQTEEDQGRAKVKVLEKCMMLWKEQTEQQKNKDRVKTLERALREMGKGDVADGVLQRYQSNEQITSDMFS